MSPEIIREIVDQFDGARDGLIAVLEQVQAKFGYLPADELKIVASATGRSLVDVYAGALVVAIWMWACEHRLGNWCLWVVALLCLGHFVSLVYLLCRLLRRRTLPELFAP